MVIQSPKIQIQENQNVNVSWSWYNQSEGIVQWTFNNSSEQEQDVILLRGAVDSSGKVLVDYYFGNAYWVVYYTAGITSWQRNNQVLQNQGVENNAPPIAVIQIGKQYLVAFEFTLPPQSVWSMLEGGFVDGIQPYNPRAIPVKYDGDYDFCIEYDEKQVQDYEQETGVPVTGYYPNPNTFKTSLYTCDGPYISLFKDYIEKGNCSRTACVNRIRKIMNLR